MSTLLKKKIKQYLTYKGVSEAKFYQKVGLPVGSLDNKDSVSVDKIRTIARVYSDINLEWLIANTGGMLKAAPEVTEDPALLHIIDEKSSQLDKIIKENEKLIEELKAIKKELPNTITASIAIMRSKEA